MNITYSNANSNDIEPIFRFCEKLINDYEQVESIDYPSVIRWVRQKIEASIREYTVIYADGEKAGYYHFYRNDDGIYEIDDLYIFPEYQNQGIGSTVMIKCCSSVDEPVILYVFIANKRAISLYEKLGFKVVKTIRSSRYIMQRNK